MNTKIYDLDADPKGTPQEDNNDTVESVSDEIVKQISNISSLKGIVDVFPKISSQNEYLDVLPDMDFEGINKYPDLLNIFPSGKKYKVPEKILNLLNNKTATFLQVASCLYPNLSKKKLRYKHGLKYDVTVRIKSLNNILKPLGYFVTTKSGTYRLIKR